jgi:hypothetical protein
MVLIMGSVALQRRGALAAPYKNKEPDKTLDSAAFFVDALPPSTTITSYWSSFSLPNQNEPYLGLHITDGSKSLLLFTGSRKKLFPLFSGPRKKRSLGR